MNASFQAARSYWNFYRIEDEVREEILHGHLNTFSGLHRRVVEIAEARGINMEYENVKVSHRDAPQDIDVHYSYVDNIGLIPKFYIKPWAYETMVGTHRLRPLIIDEHQR